MLNGNTPSPWLFAPTTPAPKPKQAFGGTLGVIAIAVGIGLVAGYVLDAHGHTCESCGSKWWHLGALNVNDQPAHTCKCGAVQWWKNGVPAEVREAHVPFGHGH